MRKLTIKRNMAILLLYFRTINYILHSFRNQPIILIWITQQEYKVFEGACSQIQRFVHVLKGCIKSIISGSFADTSVKYTTMLEIYVQPSTSYMSRFKCPATISPNSFIQIMINAAIIVNLVIYKLLMSKKCVKICLMKH